MAAAGRLGRALRKVSANRSARKKAAPAQAATKKAPAKKAPAKKAATKAVAAKAVAAKKAAAKKAAAKKAAAKKAAPLKAVAKKSPAKTAPATKAPAKKTAAKKAPAKKAPAKKAPAKKAAPAKAAKKAPAKKTVKKAPAPATKVAAKKAPAKKAPAPARLAVPAGSEWTPAELAAVRQQIVAELADMRTAYDSSMRDLDDLQRAGNDGAGDDQADAGSKTFEREQEQSIAANRLDLMTQYERALERIDSGTYGFCESCGKPIPKARLKAFPAATLDVGCKQREERR